MHANRLAAALLLLLLACLAHARPDRKKTLIIADVSASVRNSDEINPGRVREALKHAMNSYLPTGRKNKVMLYECATRSQLLLDWTSVHEKDTIMAAIDRMTFDWAYEESFTNWEACLASALDKNAKNVYFITDGNPTTYVGQPGNPPSDDSALNMQKAVAMADRLKAQGSSLTPLGVGEYVTNANLAQIAGPCGHECWIGFNYFHLTNFQNLRDGVRDGLIVHDARMADEKALAYVHTNKREEVDPATDEWILSAMDGRVLDSSSPRYRSKGNTLEGVVGREPADISPLFWPMGDERVQVHHKLNGRYVRNRLVTIPGEAHGIVGVRTHLALRATCQECVDAETVCPGGCGFTCRFCRDAWEIGSPLAGFCATNSQWLARLDCYCFNPGVCDTDCFGECGFTESPTASPTGAPTTAAPTSEPVCEVGPVVFDFETDKFGMPLQPGDDATLIYEGVGMIITAPGSFPAIFNSSAPTCGDCDIGTPNAGCGGPGCGAGGAPATPGENCVALGNILVPQDPGSACIPNDAPGTIPLVFDFTAGYRLDWMTFIDAEIEQDIIVTTACLDNKTVTQVFKVLALGSNSFQNVSIATNQSCVANFTVMYSDSGGVGSIGMTKLCPGSCPYDESTDSPTAAPSTSPTQTPTDSPTQNPSAAPSTSPTGAPTRSPSSAPSGSPTSAPSQAPSGSPSTSPTGAPSQSPSTSPTEAPSRSPSSSPSVSPTGAPSSSPSASPTEAPSQSPSTSPTGAPSQSPSVSPTESPSASPSASPTEAPSQSPSTSPTGAPSQSPSSAPSVSPTGSPSTSPSASPSQAPSTSPTGAPSQAPSNAPSTSPTAAPSQAPSNAPSTSPSASPTEAPSQAPSGAPSASPTGSPTSAPSSAPSSAPTDTPTVSPSASPTENPTGAPSTSPTENPTQSPSGAPSASPTGAPSASPTENPTQSPSGAPSASPTESPTQSPSGSPTESPTGAPSISPTGMPTVMPGMPTQAPTTSAPTPIPTPAPTPAPTGPELGTCLVHAWEDQNSNGIQEGLTRRREVMEPDLEGLKVTLVDSADVMHMGFTDADGNIEFPNVAPGPGVVSIVVPSGWILTTPPENPFDVDVPPGPGAHSIPPIGLKELDGPAVPEPRTMLMNVGAREIVAIVIGVLILMLLIGFILRAVCGREPWVWDTYTVVHVEETEQITQPPPPLPASIRRVDFDPVSAAMSVDYPGISAATGYTVKKVIDPTKKTN